jgi:hypothetical protein
MNVTSATKRALRRQPQSHGHLAILRPLNDRFCQRLDLPNTAIHTRHRIRITPHLSLRQRLHRRKFTPGRIGTRDMIMDLVTERPLLHHRHRITSTVTKHLRLRLLRTLLIHHPMLPLVLHLISQTEYLHRLSTMLRTRVLTVLYLLRRRVRPMSPWPVHARTLPPHLRQKCKRRWCANPRSTRSAR